MKQKDKYNTNNGYKIGKIKMYEWKIEKEKLGQKDEGVGNVTRMDKIQPSGTTIEKQKTQIKMAHRSD